MRPVGRVRSNANPSPRHFARQRRPSRGPVAEQTHAETVDSLIGHGHQHGALALGVRAEALPGFAAVARAPKLDGCIAVAAQGPRIVGQLEDPRVDPAELHAGRRPDIFGSRSRTCTSGRRTATEAAHRTGQVRFAALTPVPLQDIEDRLGGVPDTRCSLTA